MNRRAPRSTFVESLAKTRPARPNAQRLIARVLPSMSGAQIASATTIALSNAAQMSSARSAGSPPARMFAASATPTPVAKKALPARRTRSASDASAARPAPLIVSPARPSRSTTPASLPRVPRNAGQDRSRGTIRTLAVGWMTTPKRNRNLLARTGPPKTMAVVLCAERGLAGPILAAVELGGFWQ